MDLTDEGKVTGISAFRGQQLMQGMLSLGQRWGHCHRRRRRARLFRRSAGHGRDRDRRRTERGARRLGGRREMSRHEAGACHWLMHVFKSCDNMTSVIT